LSYFDVDTSQALWEYVAHLNFNYQV